MKQYPVLPAEDPTYPSSDGLPLAENDWQLKAIHDAYGALTVRYRNRPDIYVSCDLLIYYDEGDPRKSVAPDVFVVFGAAKHNRMIYKLWEEPKAPDFVLEVASENTWREDLGRKRTLYAQLGVREYWLFDPKAEYFDPPLQGLGLRGRAYRALPARVENGARTIRSQVLGLDLRIENQALRFCDVATGERLRSHFEATTALGDATAALAEARTDLAREKAARRTAEARIAALEARLRGP